MNRVLMNRARPIKIKAVAILQIQPKVIPVWLHDL